VRFWEKCDRAIIGHVEAMENSVRLDTEYRRNAGTVRTGILGAGASLCSGILLFALYSRTHAAIAILLAVVQIPFFVWSLFLWVRAYRYILAHGEPTGSMLDLQRRSQ
jgi:hypothetical protein